MDREGKKIKAIDQNLSLTESRLKVLNSGINDTESRIKDIVDSTEVRTKKYERDFEDIIYEMQCIQNSIDDVVKQRSVIKNELNAEFKTLNEIEQEIMDKKEMILENQTEINKLSKKLLQRDEYSVELKIVIKQHGKDLAKEHKKTKNLKDKGRRNSSSLPELSTVASESATPSQEKRISHIYKNNDLLSPNSKEDIEPPSVNTREGKKLTKELIDNLITKHNRENTETIS